MGMSALRHRRFAASRVLVLTPAAHRLHEQFAGSVDADFQHAGRIELIAQWAQELDNRRGVAAPTFAQVFVFAGMLVHGVPSRAGALAVGFSSYTEEKSTSRAT